MLFSSTGILDAAFLKTMSKREKKPQEPAKNNRSRIANSQFGGIIVRETSKHSIDHARVNHKFRAFRHQDGNSKAKKKRKKKGKTVK